VDNAGDSHLSLTDVSFDLNTANYGGALAQHLRWPGRARSTAGDVPGEPRQQLRRCAVFPGRVREHQQPNADQRHFQQNSAGDWAERYTTLGTSGSTASPALTNVTFTGNTAVNFGGAFYKYEVTSTVRPTLKNVILWGDSAGANPEFRNSASGSVIEDSVVQGGCPPGSTCTNLITTDPMLGNLAITQASQTRRAHGRLIGHRRRKHHGLRSKDQRGIPRPHGAGCDIGAYEKVPYVSSDFDHDGISDPIKFDSTYSAWWLRSSDISWDGAYLGAGTYVRRSDFDGDGKADPAKFDTSSSLWYVQSHDAAFVGQYMGTGTYTSWPFRLRGDGKTDPAQFNTVVNALWYYGSNEQDVARNLPWPGDYQYVTGSDFDGDGKSDPAHFDSASNVLWYQESSTLTWLGVYTGPGTYSYVEASDFDGDGRTTRRSLRPAPIRSGM